MPGIGWIILGIICFCIAASGAANLASLAIDGAPPSSGPEPPVLSTTGLMVISACSRMAFWSLMTYLCFRPSETDRLIAQMQQQQAMGGYPRYQ